MISASPSGHVIRHTKRTTNASRRCPGSRTLVSTGENRVSSAARQTGIRLPSIFQWTRRELNPDLQPAALASSRWTTSPIYREVRPGVEPGLPPYRGGVPPKHLQTMIPDGVEPSLSWLSPRCLRRWTTGSSDRSGSRTHRHEALDLVALPICVPGRGGSGGRTGYRRAAGVIQAYEAWLSTGPPAVAGPGIEPGGPARPTLRAGARSQLGTCRACNLSVTKGRLELPSPKGTTF